MLAHVSPEPSHYSETLHTIQLASRIHRMRRRKLKVSHLFIIHHPPHPAGQQDTQDEEEEAQCESLIYHPSPPSTPSSWPAGYTG
jgi:hypothetical protein